MTVPSMQRLGTLIGNKRTAALMQSRRRTLPGLIQRVPVTAPQTLETLYENPNMSPGGVPIASPTAAQKQFVATPYTTGKAGVAYEMTRDAGKATVEVRILFTDQKRGEDEFQRDAKRNFRLDKAGKKIADPNYRRDIGPESPIPADDKRQAFAQEQCAKVGTLWNQYELHSKTIPPAPPADPVAGVPLPTAKAEDVKLPLSFVATPVFDMSDKNVHSKVKLFSMGVIANREGAHPIDAAHWYMDTQDNYGSNVDAITAHEYGHLLGLADEYSRSDDQTHQLMHRMGGGAKNADKLLDQHTLRQMVTLALYGPLNDRLSANVGKVAANFVAAKEMLRKQLVTAVRTTWADASLRSGIVAKVMPALRTAGLKRALPAVVDFEAGRNMPNATRANQAMRGFTVERISETVLGVLENWKWNIMVDQFKTTGGDGSSVGFASEYSANVAEAGRAGPGKAAGGGVADTVVGGGAAPLPKIAPSPTILSQLDALPATWKDPGQGLGGAYSPDNITPFVDAIFDTAVTSGIVGKIKTVGDLYRRMLTLVTSASTETAAQEVQWFVDGQVQPKILDQLDVLKAQIDTEVETAMGTPAGALAKKSPPDPNVTAMATKMHTLLTSQQTKTSYDKTADIHPGGGSAGMDVRHSASTGMGQNVFDKSGFRSDMIQPVTDQFNAKLKKTDEEAFAAKVKGGP